jgi:hypothetical protein
MKERVVDPFEQRDDDEMFEGGVGSPATLHKVEKILLRNERDAAMEAKERKDLAKRGQRLVLCNVCVLCCWCFLFYGE